MSLTATPIIETRLGQSFIQPLLQGNRPAARAAIEQLLAAGVQPVELLNGLIWPAMELIQVMHKEDRINSSTMNLATRLNRVIADQLAAKLPHKPSNGKKVLIVCGDAEPEELGGQICTELFEYEGYDVRFAGGGVPNDEVLEIVGDYRPNLLVLFGTLPSGMPAVRKLIDYLREINSNPGMQVMCCGGIYKRAEGLAEEIGADLFAADAREAVKAAQQQPQRKATAAQQTVGRTRRIRAAAESTRRPAVKIDGHAVLARIDGTMPVSRAV